MKHINPLEQVASLLCSKAKANTNLQAPRLTFDNL